MLYGGMLCDSTVGREKPPEKGEKSGRHYR
jgi:hypothetical protein